MHPFDPFDDPVNYIHPASYSVIGFEFRSGVKAGVPVGFESTSGAVFTRMPGIEHQYEIDQNIDITIINPTEQVIYNPSEVSVTADDLIFPCGYEFKTVRGLYPTEQEVIDANNLYNQGHTDLRNVYVPTDLERSVYKLENGSRLTIEPGVTIWDADFQVNPGSTLIYDPNDYSGDWNIIANGGIIIEANYDCMGCNPGWDYDDDSIDSDVTLNSDKTVRGTFTIENGAKLTLKNGMKLQMAPGAQIVVKKGSYLRINNATIEGRCNSQWQGIFVEGSPFNPQTNEYQGYFKSSNGSVIKDALVAVQAGHVGYDDGGGLIHAEETTFKNNLRSIVSAWSTHNDDRSVAEDCIFTINKKLNHNGVKKSFISYIELIETDGMRIEGCIFENPIHTQLAKDGRGMAIHAVNATTYVSQGNSFTNLFKGIDSYGNGSVGMLWVTGNEFENVRQGVTLTGTDFFEITLNTFNIPEGEPGSPSHEESYQDGDTPTWGIYTAGGGGFLISENNFSSTYNGTERQTWGVICKNSGEAGGEVYRNLQNHGLHMASVQVEGTNPNLLIDCNNYTNNANDWAITSSVQDLADQGACQSQVIDPAGNVFHIPCAGESQIFVAAGAGSFEYNHYENIPIQCYTTSLVQKDDCDGQQTGPETCLSMLGGGNDDPIDLESRIANSTNDTETQLLQNILVRAYLKNGKRGKAKQALKQMPYDYAYRTLAMTFIEEEKYNKANNQLNKLSTENPFNDDYKNVCQELITAALNDTTLNSGAIQYLESLVEAQDPLAQTCEALCVAQLNLNLLRIPEALTENVGNRTAVIFEENSTSQSSTQPISVNENLGLKEPEKFSITPNPVKDILKVSGINGFKPASYSIYDSTGKLVLEGKVNSNEAIDVASLNKGLFFIGIKTEDSYQILKFIQR